MYTLVVHINGIFDSVSVIKATNDMFFARNLTKTKVMASGGSEVSRDLKLLDDKLNDKAARWVGRLDCDYLL